MIVILKVTVKLRYTVVYQTTLIATESASISQLAFLLTLLKIKVLHDAIEQGSASNFGIGPKKNISPKDGGPEHSQRII